MLTRILMDGAQSLRCFTFSFTPLLIVLDDGLSFDTSFSIKTYSMLQWYISHDIHAKCLCYFLSIIMSYLNIAVEKVSWIEIDQEQTRSILRCLRWKTSWSTRARMHHAACHVDKNILSQNIKFCFMGHDYVSLIALHSTGTCVWRHGAGNNSHKGTFVLLFLREQNAWSCTLIDARNCSHVQGHCKMEHFTKKSVGLLL